MRKLRVIFGVALLAVGIIFIIVSVNPPEPKCGDRVMRPGDVCVVGNRAVSYAERKGGVDKKALGIGIGLGVVGSLLLIVAAAGRRRTETVAPDAGD